MNERPDNHSFHGELTIWANRKSTHSFNQSNQICCLLLVDIDQRYQVSAAQYKLPRPFHQQTPNGKVKINTKMPISCLRDSPGPSCIPACIFPSRESWSIQCPHHPHASTWISWFIHWLQGSSCLLIRRDSHSADTQIKEKLTWLFSFFFTFSSPAQQNAMHRFRNQSNGWPTIDWYY